MLKHSFKKDVKSFPVLRQKTTILISSYWMRLSRMWRIMQIEETVWITASEICVILHIIRKLDSIIVLLFIPNISKFFTSLPLCRLSPKQVSLFLDTVPRYRVFSHDVTAAILVSQNNETAAMLVSQTSPVGVELFSYANAFFCSDRCWAREWKHSIDR